MVELNANLECQVDGCTLPVKAVGYCNRNYLQVYRHGRVLTPAEEMGNAQPVQCTVADCGEAVQARGLCARHYQQRRRNGKPTPEVDRPYGREGCRVEICDRPHYAKGYCQSCYRMLRRYRTMLTKELDRVSDLGAKGLRRIGCDWGTSVDPQGNVVFALLWIQRGDEKITAWVELRRRGDRTVSQQQVTVAAERLWEDLTNQLEERTDEIR